MSPESTFPQPAAGPLLRFARKSLSAGKFQRTGILVRKSPRTPVGHLPMAIGNKQRAADMVEAPDGGAPASDARLIEDARLGDRDAFGQLVRRYERRLLRVIQRFVHDPDLSEDLAQEVFLRVYERLDQYDSARRFGPWLFRIGVNVTLDHLRRRKRRIWGMLFTDAQRDRWPDPPTPDGRQELDLQQEVRRVIEQLPEKYRIVLVLRDLEGFSTSEIAAILSRREATIRWRLAEARNRFQTIWERRHGIQAAADH